MMTSDPVVAYYAGVAVGFAAAMIGAWLAVNDRTSPAPRLWDGPPDEPDTVARYGPTVHHVFSRGRRR